MAELDDATAQPEAAAPPPALNEDVPDAEDAVAFDEIEGFAPPPERPRERIYDAIEKLQKEIEEYENAALKSPPAKKSRTASPAPSHTTDTFSSRPSSGMSVRSETDQIGSGETMSGRGRKSTVDLSSPYFRMPLNAGWKRELVYRANTDSSLRRQADVYYYSPAGKKLRSTREVADYLDGTDLTIENFTFFKEPLGIDDPEKEIIRGAKPSKRLDSPQQDNGDASGLTLEGKRTPKPKGPKGSSPELGKPLKVKSVGSRLSMSSSGSAATSPAKSPTGNMTPKSRKSDGIQSKKYDDGEEDFEPIQPPFGIEKMSFAPDKLLFGLSVDQHNPRPYPSTLTDAPKPHPVMKKFSAALPASNPAGGRDMCPMRCPLANKEPPTLQCSLCLCLYHSRCTGFLPSSNTSYVCKNCHLANSSMSSSPPSTPAGVRPGIKTSPTVSGLPKHPTTKPQPKLVPVIRPKPAFGQIPRHPKPDIKSNTKNNYWPGGNKLPDAVIGNADPSMFPQSIAIVNGHKFIVVPRPSPIGTPSQTIAPKAGDGAPKMAEVGLSASASNSVGYAKFDGVKDEQKGTSAKTFKSENYPPTSLISFDNLTTEYGKYLSKPEGFNMKNQQRNISSEVASEDSPGAGVKRKSKGPIPKMIPKIAKKTENGTAGPKGVGRVGRPAADMKNHFAEFFKADKEIGYSSLIQIFKYLKMRELCSAACVCRLWKEVADTPVLWRSVRMKNSQVNDWEGLAAALKRRGTVHLDLRKMLHQQAPEAGDKVWDQFIEHISSVDSLTSLDLCRCPASVVERVSERMPQLVSLTATSIRCQSLNPESLGSMMNLQELRIKGMTSLKLKSSLSCLESLTQLKHLSITSIDEIGKNNCSSIGSLVNLESLELGECTGEMGADVLLKNLTKLTRLRLEKCPTPNGGAALLCSASELPMLQQLELINFDIKNGFEEALAKCTNIKRLLIIPTYVAQSATTNRCVLEGVFKLSSTLTHLVWGVTLELLRVTELFIDQRDKETTASAANNATTNNGGTDAKHPGAPSPNKRKANNDCIPVLKPIPGLRSEEMTMVGRPQVEILSLAVLQHLLVSQLPETRVKLLRIPYHHTWRQTFNDFD